MHINRVLIKAQESSPKAFKIGKTPKLLGTLPPGPHQGPKVGPSTPSVMARTLDLGLFGSINFFDRHSVKMTGNFKSLAKAVVVDSLISFAVMIIPLFFCVD